MKTSKFILLLPLLAGIVIGLPLPAHATTFNVTTFTDTLTADGRCSLREAIISANTDTNYNSDCGSAGSGADTIVLRNRGYCLSLANTTEGEDEDSAATGDLDILADLTIQGAGQDETVIDAGATDDTDRCATLGDRVFDIDAGTTVSMTDLTITGGSGVSQGGGVYVSDRVGADQPVLTFSEVTVSGNAASSEGGGLFGYMATITLTDVTITENTITAETTGHGGGIDSSYSTLTLTNSTVSDNVITSGIWAHGGGIYASSSRSTIYLINSTLSGNRAEGETYSYGGGIYQSNATTSLIGSTISGNQAVGPGRAIGGGAYISGSSAVLNSKNSIISGNDVSGSSSISGADCYGTLNSYGYNFLASVTTTDNCTVTETANAGTDITTMTHDELLLGMLTDNGGDSETLALSATSPAVDAGNCESFFDLNGDGTVDTTSDVLTTDQRGQSRGIPCDIGAYEYVATATCGDSAMTGTETCDDGNTTSGDGCSSACAGETDGDADGYSPYVNDCDDTNAAIYSGATESCNDADDDCDGITDEGCATYFLDADGDSYGTSETSTSAMSLPTGYASNDNDCNDAASAVNPGAEDTCDGVDTNCDGSVDEGDTENTTLLYEDSDGDGFGDLSSAWNACTAPSGYVSDSSDCDDTAATIYPGAPEDCSDGIDQDCDFIPDYATFYADSDADGYGDAASSTGDYCEQPTGYVTTSTDCDDTNAAANPAGTETCGDGTDQDCDGTDASCPVTEDTTAPPTSETDCTNGADEDEDGASDCSDSDCDAACSDTDEDGTPDSEDTDDDSDGTPDISDTDDDDDGIADTADPDADSDDDGTSDTEDFAPTDAGESSDADSDGTGDNADTDDDNDGTADDVDTDDDGDGIADADESGSASASSSTSVSAGGGCSIGATQETRNPYALLLTLVLGFGALALPRFSRGEACLARDLP